MEDKLTIIFENPDFMIIDKRSGVTVNKSDTTSNELTLQDLIEKEDRMDRNTEDVEFINRAGIVHRLDKETSGVLIVAKNANAFRTLQAQFKERKVSKTYIALAHGIITPLKGQINVPVGRLPWNRKRFGVLSGGREASTSYEVISNFQLPITNEELSLVRLHPETGRTHQIRVHLKYINHPIFADPLYSGRKTARADRKVLPRVFLHAEEISFLDPASGERVEFKSELPIELKDLLEKFEIKNNN